MVPPVTKEYDVEGKERASDVVELVAMAGRHHLKREAVIIEATALRSKESARFSWHYCT
jgi:ribosomal protein L20A (L18A)